MELNHPFFIYPNAMMSEYNEYDHYRKEIKRFYNFLIKLNLDLETLKQTNKTKILIPIIIGSTMEDAIFNNQTDFSNIFQYQQLFPDYILKFIDNFKSEDKLIEIIIISPDKIFNIENFSPLFLIYSDFKFIKICNKEYLFEINKLKIRFNIFNCPMPCIEKRSNIIKKVNDILRRMSSNPYNINSFTQTENDILFINNFYSEIENLISKVNYDNLFVIINSWVNFKNLYGYSENYNMFPRILELANKYNIIATEWNYIDELFLTRIISNYNNYNLKNNYILYVSNDIDEFNDKILEINFNLLSDLRNIEIFRINFLEEKILDKIS